MEAVLGQRQATLSQQEEMQRCDVIITTSLDDAGSFINIEV